MSGKSTGTRTQHSGSRSQASGARVTGRTTVTTTTTVDVEGTPVGCFWGIRMRWRTWRVHRIEKRIEHHQEEVEEHDEKLKELQGELGKKKRNQLRMTVVTDSQGAAVPLKHKDRKQARANAKAGVDLNLGLSVNASA